MRIAEIFRSIQGEGRLTGVESVFVRASGCNLRCRYCDTPYASWTPEGEDLSVAEILGRVDQLRAEPSPAFLATIKPRPLVAPHVAPQVAPRGRGFIPHVVLTGGEPMIFADLVPLTAGLRKQGWHITIETAGTLFLPVTCDLMSISPKLPNSTPVWDRLTTCRATSPEQNSLWVDRHEQHRHAPQVIHRLIAQYDYQLKFVVDCPEDCHAVKNYLAEFPEIDRYRVMLMPQGVAADSLAEKAAWLAPYCEAHGLSFCPRRQIEWFGAERGK